MGRTSLGQRASLVPASYIASTEASRVAYPIVILNGATGSFPVVYGDGSVVSGTLDFSGFNTLSLFFTTTGAGTSSVYVNTIDPEASPGGGATAAVIPGNLGRATLGAALAAGDHAFTLFLPSYYTGLAGLILPFYNNVVQVIAAGATVNVTTAKLWLTNTGTAS